MKIKIWQIIFSLFLSMWLVSRQYRRGIQFIQNISKSNFQRIKLNKIFCATTNCTVNVCTDCTLDIRLSYLICDLWSWHGQRYPQAITHSDWAIYWYRLRYLLFQNLCWILVSWVWNALSACKNHMLSALYIYFEISGQPCIGIILR